MRKLFLRAWEMHAEFRRFFVVVLGFIAIMQVLGMVWPIVYGMIIDAVWKRNYASALQFALLALALDIVTNFLGFKKHDYQNQKFDYDAPRSLGVKTLWKFFDFSVGQHVNEHSGIKQTVINEGKQALRDSVELVIYNVIPIGVQFLFVIAYLFYKSRSLGTVVLAGGILFLYSVSKLNRAVGADLKKLRDERVKIGKEHQEIIQNASVIALNSQEKKVVSSYDDTLLKYGEFGKRLWQRYARQNMLVNFSIPDVTAFLVIALGAWLVIRGDYTPGFLVTVLALSSRAVNNLSMMGPWQRQMLENSLKIDRYFTMMDVESEVKVVENPISPLQYEGKIEFRGVEFAYPRRSYLKDKEEQIPKGKSEPVIRDVSFTVWPGEKVAVIGKNGAGKSTLFHLLLRSFDPDKGQILVDDNDLRLLDLTRYREVGAGYVEQDVKLFDNTLRQNILFGLNGRGPAVTDEELKQVCDTSRISSFFPTLEKGFDTLIGEKGVRLSGGQVKMVGIARAIIKNPAVLLFDEATAGLDPEEEAILYESMRSAAKGRTTLIITHRLSTVKNVDRILVFNASRLVGEGTHGELLRRCPTYKTMVESAVSTF